MLLLGRQTLDLLPGVVLGEYDRGTKTLRSEVLIPFI